MAQFMYKQLHFTILKIINCINGLTGANKLYSTQLNSTKLDKVVYNDNLTLQAL